jgi:hypothetical protein
VRIWDVQPEQWSQCLQLAPPLHQLLLWRLQLQRLLQLQQQQRISCCSLGVALGRRALGVAQLFSIELQNVHRVMTRELSCTGYVALVPATFGVGELVTFTLTLGRSIELVKGDSVVKQISKQGTNYRVVADFKGLMEPALERIEDAVFDAALSRLK